MNTLDTLAEKAGFDPNAQDQYATFNHEKYAKLVLDRASGAIAALYNGNDVGPYSCEDDENYIGAMYYVLGLK